MVKIKKLYQSLASIPDGSDLLDDHVAIQDHVVYHYKNLFSSSDDTVNFRIVERVIPSLVTVDEDISFLGSPPLRTFFTTAKSLDTSNSPRVGWI